MVFGMCGETTKDGQISVVVAVLRPVLIFEVDEFPSNDDVGWDGLPKTTIPAGLSDTLRTVLRRACDVLGVRMTQELLESESKWAGIDGRPALLRDVADHLVYVGFRRADDDERIEIGPADVTRKRNTRRFGAHVVVRDEAGRALWRRPGLDATLGELIDAADAGLIDGDPLQPYLIPSTPAGDFGGLDQWITFQNALTALGGVAGLMATLDGVLGIKDRLADIRRRRNSEAPEIVARHSSAWAERGAAPSDLLQLLVARPRTGDEVAALLGCRRDEAEAMLWALGFVMDEGTGLWIHRGDELARLLADDIDLSFADAIAVLGDTELLGEIASSRLREVLTSGRAPDPDLARRRLEARIDDLNGS
jgi:hypothetical protein